MKILSIASLALILSLSGTATSLALGGGSPSGFSTSDVDGDGLSYFRELHHGTNPYNADTDGDGINDGHEVLGFTYNGNTYFSSPTEWDTDNDDYCDSLEIQHRFSPTDHSDHFQLSDNRYYAMQGFQYCRQLD